MAPGQKYKNNGCSRGGAEMVGTEVQRFPKAGGSRTSTSGVGDDSVIARNVEEAAVTQVNTRSRTTARHQGQYVFL